MKNHRLKTNINCGGCIEKVSPYMTKQNGIMSWKVDTSSPDKYLDVETDMSREEVMALLEKAGFRGTPEDSSAPAPSCH